MIDDPETGPVFRRIGIHGDVSTDDERAISDRVEAYAAEHGWEWPDPSNLVISTVLARQMAGGGIARDDEPAALAFIDDKRCDGLGLDDTSRRPLKISEVLPILRQIEANEDLKRPFTALRGTALPPKLPSRSYFPDEEDDGSTFYFAIEGFARRLAVQKYALRNRSLQMLSSVKTLANMYARGDIDRFDGREAIDYMVRDSILGRIIDDRENQEGGSDGRPISCVGHRCHVDTLRNSTPVFVPTEKAS
ncbi:MAG: hypothetical protein AAF732_22930 [Pseudomonadota bacterium]